MAMSCWGAEPHHLTQMTFQSGIIFAASLASLFCPILGFTTAQWRQKFTVQSYRPIHAANCFQLSPLRSSISENSIGNEGDVANSTSRSQCVRITNLSPPKLIEEKPKVSFWKSFWTALQQNWLVFGEVIPLLS